MDDLKASERRARETIGVAMDSAEQLFARIATLEAENAALRAKVGRLETGLREIENTCQFQSSGYARDCTLIARAALSDPSITEEKHDG